MQRPNTPIIVLGLLALIPWLSGGFVRGTWVLIAFAVLSIVGLTLKQTGNRRSRVVDGLALCFLAAAV